MNDIFYDVITIGSNTIDAFVYTDKAESIMIKTIAGEEDFISYPMGSKLLINELDFFSGGGGTNAAVSLARMGLRVAYLGKIGSDNDSNGNKILDELKSEKVDFLGVKSILVSEKTGFSIVLDSIEKNRTILTYRGANDSIDISEIDLGKLKTGWFYLSSMLDRSFETLEIICNYAVNNKIKMIFNPDNYLCQKGINYLENILKNLEILVLNKEEATLLVKDSDIKSKLVSLQKSGPKIVAITDGVNPVNCIDSDNNFYICYPLDTKVTETTGAGDSFASAFLVGFIKTKDIEFSLKLAIANSNSVLQYKGAKNKLLTYDEACKFIAETNIKVEKF
ncbi:MAG: carbohydrate kinase family protein [Actinobacteria bacterium]|nr:carbohydrate kinase family protein [Actinomycetota bacterium]